MPTLKDPAMPTEPVKKLEERYEKARSFAGGLLGALKERESRNYNPLLDYRKLPADEIRVVNQKVDKAELTEDIVKEIEQSSLTLVIDLAFMIVEGPGKKVQAVVDSLENLEHLHRKLVAAKGLLGPKPVVIDAIRKTVARHSGKPVEEIDMPDEKLLAIAEDQFRRSTSFLGKRLALLREYLGR